MTNASLFSARVPPNSACLTLLPSAVETPTCTVPTGLSESSALGPAIPVTDIARSALEASLAPSAIAAAMVVLTAPCFSIRSSGMPNSLDFDSFE